MKKIKKCIIPAAWFGTRFLPASKALPKEMFPLIDKPVMQYLVEEAISVWCEEIIIVTGRNKRAIEDHFDANFELEKKLEESNKFESLEKIKHLNSMANIVYVRQPYPRWDWDAILRAKPFLGNEPFLVLFWDDIIHSEVSAATQLVAEYGRKNSPVIATVRVSDEEVSSYGIIESNTSYGNAFVVDKFLEKPQPNQTNSRYWVVWKYILNSHIFEYLQKLAHTRPVDEIKLADAFELMRKEKDIYGIDIQWERYDTGSKIGFLKATLVFGLKNQELWDELRDFIKKLDIK